MAEIILPAWAVYTHTLAVPIIGAAIAFAGVYIARQQKRLADIKPQNDLYDRRYKIYEAARKFLSDIQTHRDMSLDDFFTYRRGISDAVFLLPSDIVDYLNSITDAATKLRLYQTKLNKDNLADDARNDFADKAADLEGWFDKQFNILVDKFRPVMRLDEHSL